MPAMAPPERSLEGVLEGVLVADVAADVAVDVDDTEVVALDELVVVEDIVEEGEGGIVEEAELFAEYPPG